VGPLSAVPRFAVISVHGPAWDPARPLREQEAWAQHAAYMDELVDEGLILLGGPLGDGSRVLMLCEAPDAAHIDARLGLDPWRPMRLLETQSIEPWEILLEPQTPV
jgi:uncharacterized protein YciI